MVEKRSFRTFYDCIWLVLNFVYWLTFGLCDWNEYGSWISLVDVNLILVVPVGFGNLRWLRPPSGSLTRNVLIGVGFVGIPWWILFWTVGGHSGLFGLGVGSVLGWCGVLHGSRPISWAW